MKVTFLLLPILFISNILAEDADEARKSKLLPVFQVVRFPNDPCTISGGSKNGTCYTAEECSNLGGTNAGSCAEGFGVCCTFTLTCGSSTTQNTTYFESSTGLVGACSTKICKCNENICQIRLDFDTFVISGPSTSSTSIGEILNGEFNLGGKGVSEATRCLTDTFLVSNQNSLPVICGTNTGYHVYFDASDACNDLVFQFGNNANGLSATATRSFSIKVTQYSCDYNNLAPSGCDQYHFGSSGTNYIYAFNQQGGRHLADQKQTICVRRETGMCRVCWSADAATDVDLGTDTNIAAGFVKGELCCAYDVDGLGLDNKGPYDCLMIPGARKASDSAVKPASICGNKAGLVSASGSTSVTLCSKSYPFRIVFHSDGFEMSAAAMDEGTAAMAGFKLRYFQTSC